MPMTSKEMVKLLKENGFEELTQTGSHLKMYNKASGKVTIVPMHDNDLKKGTERSILKQAGLK